MAPISPSIERVPTWQTWPWLRAGFSTRRGGRSSVYGSGEQNLGWTAEDDAEIVRCNRAAFVALAGEGRAMQIVTLQQVHGSRVRDLDAEALPLMSPEGKALLTGDGLFTGTAGRLLGILTADCVPVLVVDARRRAVAAFHAGWRGTVAGIVEQGVAALQSAYKSDAETLWAAIGPSIGACCFEVGEEVRDQFRAAFPYGDALVSRSASSAAGEARFHVNLQEANRRQLIKAGVAPETIWMSGECTACTRLPDGRPKYFSHRAERGITGRMLSVIGVAGESSASSPTMVTANDAR